MLPLGVVLTIAALVGCALAPAARTPPFAVVVGLVLLGIGAAIARSRLAWAFALGVPGAALVGLAGDLDPARGGGSRGLAIATVLGIVVLAPLVADADAAWSRARSGAWSRGGAGPIALAISGIGLFVCVPDTEEARVLAVVLLVGAVASLLPALRSLGRVGAAPLLGLYLWVGAYDARGREAAFVGVLGALALLVLEPLGARLRGRRPALLSGAAAAGLLLVGQVGLAAYASRVPGFQTSVPRAIALLAPAILVGLVLSVAAGASRHATEQPKP